VTTKILVVDDDASFRRLLVTALRQDHVLAEAASGEEAIEQLDAFEPAVVFLDVMMPGIDGYETCSRIKSHPAGSRAQVVMVSAHSSRAEQLRGYEAGADDYLVKPVDLQELRSRLRLHLHLREAMGNVAAIREEIESRNHEIRQLAERRAQELLLTQDVAIFTLARVAESRDQLSSGHHSRVRSYCQILAEQLAQEGPYRPFVSRQFREDLYRSSPLHDIGKVAIADEILLKPGRLTPEEFARMQQHTIIGANILDQAVAQSCCGGFLAMAAVIARFHHERFDGSGYLAGLVGNEIPLPARIVAVADVYDALTSERSYKAAQPPARARAIIAQESGRQFDPVIVDAFHARFPDFLNAHKKHVDSMQFLVGAMAFREYEFEFAEM